SVDDGGDSTFGSSDAWDTFGVLTIDGTDFAGNGNATGDLEDDFEIIAGPETMGDLTVTRKILVSPDDGFARWLDILENTTAVDVSVPVHWSGNLGSDEGNINVATSSNGNTTLEAGDVWWVNGQGFVENPDAEDPFTAQFTCGGTFSKEDD